MKLTIDCVLSAESSDLRSTCALAQLLAIAKVTQVAMPLEALVCEQHGLQAAPDYPIAAISAAVDGLDVGDAYWLRADPVHLVLQRDCFSLGESIPLPVIREHADSMIASLNQHFNQDGLVFMIGNSGAWYLYAAQSPQLKTTLPSVAAGKNIHQFMPQGLESSKWLAVLNEVQMLLFEHPANQSREAAGIVAVNSVWFSGGGVMPQTKALQNDTSVLVANSAFYQGLATWAGLPLLALPNNLDDLLLNSNQHLRLQLPSMNNLDDNGFDQQWFSRLLSELKSNKIKQLRLNLGFYEKSLTVDIKPIDTYKFWLNPIWRNLIWRNPKPVMDYLK